MGVRSRIRQSASVSLSRAVSVSTSLVWSFQIVTSWPATLLKHFSVRTVSCQSSSTAIFMSMSSAESGRTQAREDDVAEGRHLRLGRGERLQGHEVEILHAELVHLHDP